MAEPGTVEYNKENHPLLYGATAWLGNNLKKSDTAVNTARTVNTVADAVDNSIDIAGWFISNWQLAIVGAVALLVLIKRL